MQAFSIRNTPYFMIKATFAYDPRTLLKNIDFITTVA